MKRGGVKGVGFGLTAFGVLLLVGAAWYTWEAFDFWRSTELTEGVVIEHVLSGTTASEVLGERRTHSIYWPVIRFADASGRDIQFRSRTAESDPPPVGAVVAVRYPVADPFAARVAGLGSLMGGAGILSILGLTMLGSGWLALRRAEAMRPG